MVLIRCANDGFVVEKTLTSGLAVVFYNTFPLGGQAQPGVFFPKIFDEASQGHLRSRMSNGVSQSRASTLAKGFENP